MSPFNNNIFYLFIFNKLVEIQSLVELRTAKNNIIVTTEAITRKTVNELFSTLRLKGVKQKPSIKQFLTIHNFFVSLTLKDHNNFNKIVQLTRAKQSDNSSLIAITLNELLSEDNSDAINDDSITEHVEIFLNNLRYLKEKFRVDSLSEDTIINEEIMKVLIENPVRHSNDTFLDLNNDNRVLDDIETWFPEPDQEQKGRRIFQGHTTKAKHYPFMASIQFFNQFQCAGSIIKSDLIISAASCLQLAYNNRFFRENPAFLSVRVGSTFYEGGGENIPILEVYFHPSYDPKSLKHNLVLLRMIRRVNFKITKKKVKKIDIDRYASPLPENTDGITVVGWGAKETSNKVSNPWYNRLSYAVLDFYPLRECAEIYTKEFVTRTNFCAGFMSKGGGACNRDVGGPGIVDGGILAGVISFGSPVCGAPDAPTVFTKVGFYSDWIDEIMEQDVPRTARKTTLKPIPPEPTVPPSHLIRTTFKVDPLIGKIRPQPDELGGLRNQDESDIFNKFIEAMFGSKEVKESADMIDSLRQKMIDEPVETLQEEKEEEVTEVTTTDAPLMTGLAAPTTVLDVYDISQEVTEQTPKFTVLSENLLSSVEQNLEKDIVRLFDDIDLKKLIDDPKMDTPPKSIEKKALTDKRKTTDDSILTLLYLTDTEKKNNKSSEENGLSISVESFKDLTFRNNITANELINLMSQSDLFKLLSATFQADTNENDSFDNTNTLDT